MHKAKFSFVLFGPRVSVEVRDPSNQVNSLGWLLNARNIFVGHSKSGVCSPPDAVDNIDLSWNIGGQNPATDFEQGLVRKAIHFLHSLLEIKKYGSTLRVFLEGIGYARQGVERFLSPAVNGFCRFGIKIWNWGIPWKHSNYTTIDAHLEGWSLAAVANYNINPLNTKSIRIRNSPDSLYTNDSYPRSLVSAGLSDTGVESSPALLGAVFQRGLNLSPGIFQCNLSLLIGGVQGLNYTIGFLGNGINLLRLSGGGLLHNADLHNGSPCIKECSDSDQSPGFYQQFIRKRSVFPALPKRHLVSICILGIIGSLAGLFMMIATLSLSDARTRSLIAQVLIWLAVSIGFVILFFRALLTAASGVI